MRPTATVSLLVRSAPAGLLARKSWSESHTPTVRLSIATALCDSRAAGEPSPDRADILVFQLKFRQKRVITW